MKLSNNRYKVLAAVLVCITIGIIVSLYHYYNNNTKKETYRSFIDNVFKPLSFDWLLESPSNPDTQDAETLKRNDDYINNNWKYIPLLKGKPCNDNSECTEPECCIKNNGMESFKSGDEDYQLDYELLNGKSCPAGKEVAEDDCVEAAKEVLYAHEEGSQSPHKYQGTGLLIKGNSWETIPSGCLIQKNGWKVHYNRETNPDKVTDKKIREYPIVYQKDSNDTEDDDEGTEDDEGAEDDDVQYVLSPEGKKCESGQEVILEDCAEAGKFVRKEQNFKPGSTELKRPMQVGGYGTSKKWNHVSPGCSIKMGDKSDNVTLYKIESPQSPSGDAKKGYRIICKKKSPTTTQSPDGKCMRAKLGKGKDSVNANCEQLKTIARNKFMNKLGVL